MNSSDTNRENNSVHHLRGRNLTVTATFSFALLTSGRSRVDGVELVGVTGETDNFGEGLDEVVEDGVVGLPVDFATGSGAAGDFRDRNGETVEEALWERLYPAADIDGEGEVRWKKEGWV